MRMRGVLLIGMLALAGCDQAPASMPITAASMSELAVVNNKVNDLTAKVEELEKNMPSLEDRVHVLKLGATRSEEHTSELQSLMRISYAVFCLKKKNNTT